MDNRDLVKRLRDSDGVYGYQSQLACEAADALEACARDAARLDWLDSTGTTLPEHQGAPSIRHWNIGGKPDATLRAAIDRARGEP